MSYWHLREGGEHAFRSLLLFFIAKGDKKKVIDMLENSIPHVLVRQLTIDWLNWIKQQ